MSPEIEQRCIVLGTSPVCTATLAAVGGAVAPGCEAHAATMTTANTGARTLVMSSLHSTRSMLGLPDANRMWQHADGLDMVHDLQAAASEYLGWLQLEANRSPNTVRAYESELAKLIAFLSTN